MISSVKKISLTALLTAFLVFSFNTINAQCFEIESILVDACGPTEQDNEMVRFKVGSTSLNTANLTVDWPTAANGWLGIVQNAGTATTTSSLNSSISGCGLLIEPTGGVLPAGKTVLLITSSAIDITANSFANLNDTLYIIYQNAGNSLGHFGNYNSSPGLRELSMSFSTPAICNDTVIYDRTQLLNISGGYGGTAAQKNGASVNFTPSGIASYFNNGCQAPFTPAGISAAVLPSSSLQICPGDNINLFGTLIGTFDSIQWSGGLGTYNTPLNDTTTYFSSTSDVDSFYIKIKGFNSCASGISDSVLVYFVDSSDVSILEGITANLCQGTSLVLNASGASNYLWSTNATTSSISINSAAQYFVTDTTNHCFPDTAFIQVSITTQPTVSITENDTSICQGETVTLHANGANNYTWSNTSNTDSISVITSGTYFVYSTLPCPSDTDTVVVSVIQPITVFILESDPSILCQGSSLVLHASPSSTNYTWNTGENTDSITINSSGTYTITFSDNICPNTSASINIIEEDDPTASIVGNNQFCIGESLFLDANGTGAFTWSNGDNGSSTMITSTQEITLTATNFCGVATDVITITEVDCSFSDSTYIFIPNVITPNNDNSNDIFKVDGFGIESFSGSIYNRWGKLLFKWNDINTGWDGIDHSEGTYFYVVEITFINDENAVYKGSMELFK
jgi:gliding motility-associated-like protein